MEQITTVDKALDVLFHLNRHAKPRGVSDIGRALDMPKSSTHRLLAALSRRGLVEREGGKYRPGIALLGLAMGVLDREPLVAAARGVLEDEAAELNETFFLVGARAGVLTILDKAEGSGVLRASPRIGATLPAHATASGQLYLGLAPEQITLDPELRRFTARTPRDEASLERAAAEAARRGYAISRDEVIDALTIVAAPVITAGRLRGVVAVAIPNSRLARHEERDVIERVRAAAVRIAGRLEGSGNG